MTQLTNADELVSTLLECRKFASNEIGNINAESLPRIIALVKNLKADLEATRYECPACRGSKKQFDKTYGSERQCTLCKGYGSLTYNKMLSLELL